MKLTEVRRISKPELRLIEVLRQYDLDRIVDALDEGVESTSITSSELLRAMRFALKPNVFFSLPVLQDEGVITAEEFSLLDDAIKSSRNILVLGGASSGRTSCLQSLLQHGAVVYDSSTLMVLESAPELAHRFLNMSIQNVKCHNTSLLSASDLLMLLGSLPNTLAYMGLGDIRSERDNLLLHYVMTRNIPIMGVLDGVSLENLQTYLKSVISKQSFARDELWDTFTEGMLVVVCSSRPSFRYKVYKVEDIFGV